jgi:dTDP-glucose 4,6-dehydratase
MRLVVTGGSGFIGSAVVRAAVAAGHEVVNVDIMTYAATEGSTAAVADSNRYVHEQVDIRDRPAVAAVFDRHHPDAVIHLAAESHVDRSIDEPDDFISTNVVGTSVLLAGATAHLGSRGDEGPNGFRFVHVSTDEVFGSLGESGRFAADTPYDPRSPYSASKAASDHLARAWRHTYGLPVVVTNCSNNYGPFQFPEKLIPLMTISALRGAALPVYGSGENMRDWLFVEDHAAALLRVAMSGEAGATYLFGGGAERSNLDVVHAVCDLLDDLAPRPGASHRDSIEQVVDRPGHDFRYAIDYSASEEALGWRPSLSFEEGLRDTVRWYLENEWWWGPLVDSQRAVERRGLRTPRS